MRVELDTDTCDRVTLETLKEWHEDAEVSERGSVFLLKALEVVIAYSTTEAEYREWEAQRSAE